LTGVTRHRPPTMIKSTTVHVRADVYEKLREKKEQRDANSFNDLFEELVDEV